MRKKDDGKSASVTADRVVAAGGNANEADHGANDIIYVCGYEQFHRQLRNSEIIKFIADKFYPNTVDFQND